MKKEKYLDYSSFKNRFFDEFGNRINNFITQTSHIDFSYAP